MCHILYTKHDLRGLSVSVGDSIIQQSSKVRNLGLLFDQFLSFDDYNVSSFAGLTRNIEMIIYVLTHDATAPLIHVLISISLD